MTWTVAPIPVGTRLVDTVAAYTTEFLDALVAAKVDGPIMYLGGNATPSAIAGAHARGMGVVFVNFSHKEGWLPSVQLGQSDAAQSVRLLTTLGVPTEGLVDWCDLEGCGGDPTGYLDAWCATVAQQGRIAGLYVGAGGLLSAQQLYALPFTRYWQSESEVPAPACGFCQWQLYSHPQSTVGGVPVDFDFAGEDKRGRFATWLVAA